ncbi:Ca2+:H+ antiporter [Singulisphaera sp. GP187]|uniref:calcium/proton exchanger n=1 Tax=Singulisphaera sp. GP187 TaxID=1882752 RepID=UPI00092C6B09|nr:calcium/proton exchanger [Singulisphaera sp. GP187]SIO60410.1 Ca2+:H+ antiporter [Singulisphaera sp. GP187]
MTSNEVRASPPDTPTGMGLGLALHGLAKQPLTWLLLAMPVALGLELFHAGALSIFLFSGLAVIPLAGLMGRATENLAETLGAGIGGLLNATFGNAAELLIALLILWRGPAMYPLVKATITGSIIGNVLLVLGMAILCGGLVHQRQEFNRTAASMGATLLVLASIGLIMPTVYYYLFRAGTSLSTTELHSVESLSEEIAVILAVIYGLSLVFSLRTHQHLFGGSETELPSTGEHHQPEWSRRTSLIVLVLATAGVAGMAHLLVGTVEQAGRALGMNQVFIGVIVVSVVGNAAEHSTAVLVAMKNKMDLAVNIAVGSSLQIALFVAPVLVFASMLMGHPHPLDLHFSPLELISVVLAVSVLTLVCQDGESHWMEGAMLIAVYIILGLAFYHLPVSAR